ncbi:UAA-domain-containing protein [Exidia glandulosa HHB12029]|uniref:UAA-domain-containing protein n=1 Tax=Exidia glandulosa HHB12029 TaxID=1314781 RepID=A0A166APT3_EXIGL|nr:UAA-domain-containing protein [Exidia glandulosa HHB12029]
MSLASALVQASAKEWLTIVSLVFGGCCSNALALEWLTSENAHAGKLITFAQFALVSIVGLANQIRVETTPRTAAAVVRKAAARVLTASRTRVGASASQPFVLVVDGTSNAVSTNFTNDLALEILSQDPSVHVARSSAGSLPHSTKPTTILIADSVSIDDTQHSDAAIVFSRLERSHPTGSCLVLHPSRLTNVLASSGCFSSFDRTRIYLKERKIPISVWFIQVVLFLLTALLNNAAFAYKIPMSVHIIFRSAGSLTNMVIGRLIGRRYSPTQVASVLLVTAGVAASTFSAMPKASHMSTNATTADFDSSTYLTGVLILSLALVFSSVMGLEQDRAYRTYGRGHWEEAMFYLHFLALPMFALMRSELAAQIATANASPPLTLSSLGDLGSHRIGGPLMMLIPPMRLRIPSMYVPLALNVLTQLVCISGVHRLTARVSSLTVTLVLVLRKAVSLWISVVLLGRGARDTWLWGGALAVLAGTLLYALDPAGAGRRKEKEKKE